VSSEEHESFAAARGGDRAYYYWLYPNFMINVYEGVMDTNLVLPLATDRCLVQFDFFFKDVSSGARPANMKSVAVSERIQDEDVDICESVQRGLHSRAYGMGRLSVRREGGEHLFHRLLAADLRRATNSSCWALKPSHGESKRAETHQKDPSNAQMIPEQPHGDFE
jgi:choline monooxygenase